LPPQNVEPPALLIIAGPNGSGKSTAYRDTDIEAGGRSLWIVNPDLLTERIQLTEGLPLTDANRAAVDRIEAWIEASIDVHKSIGVETVLSTDKYRRLVAHAKSRGFAIWLIYVVLDSPERNVERVRLRVKKGGHAVPEDKIRARYVRSLQQFPWFLDQADRAWIYDNSGAEIKKIGEKEKGVISLDETALPAVVDAVQKIRTE
jgi:predicted ABC-type ATPase